MTGLLILIPIIIALTIFITNYNSKNKKDKKTDVFENKFTKDESEFVILLGSETSSTIGFASLFKDALLSLDKKVFLSNLNDYSSYKKAKQLIVFTATFGAGEAPSNADNFEKLFNEIKIKNKLKYSVLGFGSLAYPDYCQYAIDVDNMFKGNANFSKVLDLYKINSQSMEAFKDWLNLWGSKNNLTPIIKTKKRITLKKDKSFVIESKTKSNIDNTFMLSLRAEKKKIRFKSGDLFALNLNNEDERIYSIGKINKNIVLSVKLHENGIGSNYLNNLNVDDIIKGSIQKNFDFNFPSYAKKLILIANGTGIAPFLGLIGENKNLIDVHLFWGGRTKESFEIYKESISENLNNGKLKKIQIAYSKETNSSYVQDLIIKNEGLVVDSLKNEGVIMICGSVNMQKEVIDVLSEISINKLKNPLSEYENMEQIKMDCY